ncbi:MAG: nucleotidyltransferase domain-containing protein, partial [Lewinella sp.]
MDTRREKYLQASKVYVDQTKHDDDVIGIIVSGSVIHGRLDKNSDIDVHVILRPDCDYRERGNTWINGIEIECFKNPPAQIKTYFAREQARPHTAHMLAHGHIAYSSSSIVEELVATAKSIITQVPPTLKPHELEFHKYFLDDDYKDLEDAILNKDAVGTALIRHKIINRCINVCCAVHRVRRGKDKRLVDQLDAIDSDFAAALRAAVGESGGQITSIVALRTNTEDLLGGSRSLEWRMRSG